MHFSASTSKRVRGATRGINTERLIAASGGTKLVVAVPLEVGLPVRENATRLASWLGVQIRMAAPLKDMEKWDDIPFAIKAPIIQATRVNFSLSFLLLLFSSLFLQFISFMWAPIACDNPYKIKQTNH